MELNEAEIKARKKFSRNDGKTNLKDEDDVSYRVNSVVDWSNGSSSITSKNVGEDTEVSVFTTTYKSENFTEGAFNNIIFTLRTIKAKVNNKYIIEVGDKVCSISVEYDDVRTVRHDLVSLMVLDQQTDQKISEVFPEYKGPYVKKTPDFIIKKSTNNYVFLEVGTSVRNAQTYYKFKLDKYTLVSEDIMFFYRNKLSTDLKIKVNIVVCDEKEIVENNNTSDLNKILIKNSFTLGQVLRENAEKEGWVNEFDKDFYSDDLLDQIIDKMFKECSKTLSENNKPNITLEMLDWIKAAKPDPRLDAEMWRQYSAETITELTSESSLSSTFVNEKFISDFKSNFSQKWGKKSRKDMKPVVPFPLLTFTDVERKQIPVIEEELFKNIYAFSKTEESIYEISNEVVSAEMFLWQKLAEKIIEEQPNNIFDPYTTPTPVFAEETKMTGQWAKNLSGRRNKANRITLNEIPTFIRDKMAENGVQGKKQKDSKPVKAARDMKKLAFDLKTDTSDIKDFLTYETFDKLFKESKTSLWAKHLDNISELDKFSAKAYNQTLQEFNKSSKSFMREFLNTEIGNHFYVMERVFEELNLSLQQFTERDQFLIKRIDDLPFFLLIKSTTMKSHIFYSIAVDKTRVDITSKRDTVFSNIFYETDKFLITKFRSANRNRLSHYLTMGPTMAGLLALDMDLFGLQISYKDLFKGNESIVCNLKETFLWQLLIYGEGKQQTSANLQIVRFAYMEVCKLSLLTPLPMKAFAKFDDKPRSRLYVLFLEKFEKNFKAMLENKVEPAVVSNYDDESYNDDEEESEEKSVASSEVTNDYTVVDAVEGYSRSNNSTIKYEGLINVFTGRSIDDFEIALNLSYMGTLHNKEEGEETQSYFQIYDKIIKEENFFKEVDIDLTGFKDKSNNNKYKSHEFSRQFAINAGYSLREYLRKKLGRDPKAWVENKAKTILKTKMTEELATFKSSALFPVVINYKEEFEKSFRSVQENPYKTNRNAIEETESIRRETGYDDTISDNSDNKTENAERKASKAGKLMSEEEKKKEACYRVEKKMNKRRKVFEGVLELLQGDFCGVYAFENIDKIYSELKFKNDGVHASLFKKQQIGGVREIFILDIYSRFIIHFMESIARAINEMLDCEMLTKGNLKLFKSNSHFDKISPSIVSPKKVVITSIDSGDCTTWAQRFVVSLFGFILAPILSDKMTTIIMGILDLVMKKKLELPGKLMTILFLNEGTDTYNENMRRLKEDFYGSKKNGLLSEPYSVLLTNFTNMMQGICHYISSTMHAAFRIHMREIIKGAMFVLGKSKPHFNNVKVKRTEKVSSDDFSLITTFVYSKTGEESVNELREIKLDMIKMLSILSRVETKFMEALTMKASIEKSTYAALNYLEEFNSIWIVSNTIMTPKIKFVYSSSRIKPLSSFAIRANNYFDSLRQLLENGGSTLLCAIVQESQCIAHYQTMGLFLNSHFEEYKSLLMRTPSVSLGYFAKSSEFCCGIFNFDMTHYLLCSRCEEYSKTENMLLTQNGVEFDEIGLARIRTYFHIGQGAKYRRFLLKITEQTSFDWRNFLETDENFVCLYRRSKTKDEVLCKMFKKAFTPSTADTFAFPTASKLYVAGAYMINYPTIVVRYNDESSEIQTYKQSLIGYMRNLETSKIFDENQLTVFFPTRSVYEEIIRVVESIYNFRAIPTMRNVSKKYTILKIPRSTTSAHVPLIDCVRYKWFNMDTKYTQSEINTSWKIYTSAYKFLKSTYGETFDSAESVLKSHSSLHGFISSITEKESKISVLSKGRKQTNFLDTVKNIIENTYDNNVVLQNVEGRENPLAIKVSSSLFQDYYSSLYTINTMPLTDYVKIKVLTKISEETFKNIDIFKTYVVGKAYEVMSKRDKILFSMAYFLKHMSKYYNEMDQGSSKDYFDSTNLQTLLSSIGTGFIGFFSKRQSFRNGKYKGMGVYSCIVDNVLFRFHLFNNKVFLIETNRTKYMLANGLVVKRILKEIGVELSMTEEKIQENDEVRAVMTLFRNRTKNLSGKFDLTKGRMYAYDGLNLVQVYEAKEISTYLEDVYASDISFSLKENAIVMQINIKRSGRKLNEREHSQKITFLRLNLSHARRIKINKDILDKSFLNESIDKNISYNEFDVLRNLKQDVEGAKVLLKDILIGYVIDGEEVDSWDIYNFMSYIDNLNYFYYMKDRRVDLNRLKDIIDDYLKFFSKFLISKLVHNPFIMTDKIFNVNFFNNFVGDDLKLSELILKKVDTNLMTVEDTKEGLKIKYKNLEFKFDTDEEFSLKTKVEEPLSEIKEENTKITEEELNSFYSFDMSYDLVGKLMALGKGSSLLKTNEELEKEEKERESEGNFEFDFDSLDLGELKANFSLLMEKIGEPIVKESLSRQDFYSKFANTHQTIRETLPVLNELFEDELTDLLIIVCLNPDLTMFKLRDLYSLVFKRLEDKIFYCNYPYFKSNREKRMEEILYFFHDLCKYLSNLKFSQI